MKKNDNRGVTLTELIVGISIVGILAVALGFTYVGWMGAYRVESQIKQLYSDMLNARFRAMQTKQNYFLDISPDCRFYRVMVDDSNGTAKAVDGDGIAQEQATWTAIQTSNPLSWGSVAATKDTTINQLSRKIEMSNKTPTSTGYYTKEDAGFFYGLFAVPGYPWTFRLGFDKNGTIKNMYFSIDPATGNMAYTAATNIQNAVPLSHPSWSWGNPTICIFTDYDGDGTSDYNPDYDCIVASETRIVLGKITRQNTAGDWCNEWNCVIK